MTMQVLRTLILIGISAVTQFTAAEICADSGPIDKVHLVGLFETSTSSICDMNGKVDTFGLSLALAAEYILDLINSRNDTELSVPGVRYEFKLESICNNRSLATRTAAVNIPETLWTDQQICLSQSPSGEQQDSLLLGFLGPAFSSNTKYVGQFLNNTNIPLITPSATLAEFNDKSKYHSLLRTATSDDKQTKTLIDFAIKMEWTYILLVHTNDNYGRQGAKAIKKYGDFKGLCFANETIEVELHPTDPFYYQNIAEKINSHRGKGVIYFGQSSPASEIILNYPEGRRIIDSKVILASDGVGTSPEVLLSMEKNTKRLLRLITLAPYNAKNNLETYIQQRIEGTKSGTEETTKLIDQCNRSDFTHELLLKASDATQPTINAIVAFLHAFKTTHENFCEGEFGICQALSRSPAFYPTMLKSLLETPIHVNIGNVSIALNFDSKGEFHSLASMPAFSLNVAKVNKSGKWKFEPVGWHHHNGTWSYTNEALLQPNYGSRCSGKCDICRRNAAPYIYQRSEKSRYIIAGTAAVNDGQDQHDCGQTVTQHGFVIMESFYYSVQQIQQITDIEFATLFIDTCYAKLGTHAIMNQIFREEETAYLKDSTGKEWPIKPTDFVAFIGDASSGVSLVLQTYLSLYNIPQISYRSTSIWLSDSMRYPMFLRNVPSDDKQARLMIDIVHRNNWKNIGLIHSDSVYGQTGGNLVKDYAAQSGICISYYREVGIDGVVELARDIRTFATNIDIPQVFVIFAEEALIANFLRTINKYFTDWKERGIILIGSETWNRLQSVIQGVEPVVYGSLTFSFSDSTFSWTVNSNNYFKQYLKTQKPTNNFDNPLFIRFWQQYFNCYLLQNSLTSKSRKCEDRLSLVDAPPVGKQLDYEDVVGKHVVMAGLSVAYAIREATDGEEVCIRDDKDVIDCSALFDTEPGRKRFFRFLQETKIPQVANNHSKTYAPFLNSGDGKANYKVYNIRKSGAKAVYQNVYNITDGRIVEIVKPSYYIGGELVPYVDSPCNAQCQKRCIHHTGIKGKADISATTVSDEPQSEDYYDLDWLLPLLVVMFVFLVVPVVAAGLYFIYLRRTASEQYCEVPKEEPSSQEDPPAAPDTLGAPAPEPTTTDMTDIGQDMHRAKSLSSISGAVRIDSAFPVQPADNFTGCEGSLSAVNNSIPPIQPPSHNEDPNTEMLDQDNSTDTTPRRQAPIGKESPP